MRQRLVIASLIATRPEQAEQAVEAAQTQQLETLQDAELSGSANEGNSTE